MTPTIEARELRKRYGKTQALDGLDLVAEPGQVVAVLGPNGAGKTTFIRAVATLLRLDGGTLRVAGHDVSEDAQAVRAAIGLAGQFAAVEPAMTGRENLQMVARLFGQSRREAKTSADAVLEQLGLEQDGDRLVRTYSGGMRRRLDLGASLVGAPRLLLLDEPTTGLDPRSRIELWEAIRKLVAAGTDVLLTTQYLDEADQLSDRIAVINHGRVIAEGTSAELKASVGAGVLQVRLTDPDRRGEAQQLLGRELHASIRLAADPALLSAQIASSDSAHEIGARAARALTELTAAGISVDQFALGQPSLDEAFLALTGGPAPTTQEMEAR
jgi:daunorubicin resistance ABC transporter ATP-binding subunit